MKSKRFSVKSVIIAQLVLALLIGLYFAVFNPSKKIEEAKREAKIKDTLLIKNALNKYLKDNNGLPPNFPPPKIPAHISKNNGGVGDICSNLVPKYIHELPVNPELSLPPIRDCQSDYQTGYYVAETGEGIEVYGFRLGK